MEKGGRGGRAVHRRGDRKKNKEIVSTKKSWDFEEGMTGDTDDEEDVGKTTE